MSSRPRRRRTDLVSTVSLRGANLVTRLSHLPTAPPLTTPRYLPVPAFNIINGGSHAGNKLAMQALIIL